ncbi:hypothetical protein BOX15_Mlig013310g1, partial [Macrostomum lignano]
TAMNSLTVTEPVIGLLVYDRFLNGIRRLVARAGPQQSAESTAPAAVLLKLEESAFREFVATCGLAESSVKPENIRQCSAVHLLPGVGTGLLNADMLAIRIGGNNGVIGQRRGFRTSTSRRSSDGQQQQYRYTGIGKRAGGQRPSAGISLGRIFSGQSDSAATQQHHQLYSQHPGEHVDTAQSSSSGAASAQMQNLLRSVSRDLPLDAHGQSAVLLRLVDAYTRGVRDGVGHSGSGGGGTDSRQRRVSESAWKFFLGMLKTASVVGALYLLVSLLNPRDSLSKVMLTDISVQKETSKVRFDDVRGCDTAKRELEDVVEFLKHPEDFQRIGARLPRGVLLVGPPGVGKTMLAKAVAGEAGVPFFQCSGSQFDEVFVGTGAARVRRLFEEAKKAAPCVIFIDEFDSVGGKRVTTTHHPYANQTVNQLLAEMDGFSTQNGIIVLAATNRPEILDSAVTRPGRFDVSVQVHLPDLVGRTSILELYLSKVSIADDVDIDRLAKITIGFSGAQLANVINQGAVIAALEREQCVNWRHIQTAYNKVRMGTVGNKPRTPHVNTMTAAHESGHTLVALFTKDAPKVNHVTILPRGLSLGHTAPLPDEADQFGSRKSQILAQIDMFMGGQAAEELMFGPDSVTTGCSSDLQQATQLARSMVEKYGMSDGIGVMTVSAENSSQQTLAQADSEVKRILEDSRERVRRLVRDHRQELEQLTNALLEFESLDYDDILRVVSGKKPFKVNAKQQYQQKLLKQQQQQQQQEGRDASWLKTLLGGGGSGAVEGSDTGATSETVKPQSPKI